MFSHPKVLFLVSLLFVALYIEFNPYLPFELLIFYHSYNIIWTFILIRKTYLNCYFIVNNT